MKVTITVKEMAKMLINDSPDHWTENRAIAVANYLDINRDVGEEFIPFWIKQEFDFFPSALKACEEIFSSYVPENTEDGDKEREARRYLGSSFHVIDCDDGIFIEN